MMSPLSAPDTEDAVGVTTFGASWDGRGTDFAVYAGRAERVTLCLFEAPGSPIESLRVELDRRGDAFSGVWHARVDDAPPGTFYGYRVDGPWDPRRGLFHNPTKLLIDPWAKAVTGEPRADVSLLPFLPGGELRNDRDSAGFMPKGVVTAGPGAPGGREPRIDRPRVDWRDTVIYELHVGGMTRQHPEIPEKLRGTYLGLCSEPMLEHFKTLGITSLELLPVHQAAPEAHLLAQGRRNYWGYAPVSFFAPSAAYATDPTGAQVEEFRTMVDTLHGAGLEVLLDVVFNHTAEGGLGGPIYGPKGFDACAFYRWSEGQFVDLTGTGNTLDIRSPIVVEMVLASLRYWVGEMGVDGFRFDLAPTIGRDPHAFTAGARLFEAIRADPLLAESKLIAEPWDLGPGGYQLGSFPAPWREWNDRFRDTTRRFWRGEASGPLCSDLATRLAGSQDVFAGRTPHASLNYVTAHDGFTLTDLVSYTHKHNWANGEENRDGRDENFSRNWGVEGLSDDAEVLARRSLARRNLLATLLLAQGVPMIAHGDEIGRTQLGNNNVYCQDNELAWMDWSAVDADFMDFVAGLTRLRRRYGHLRRESFFTDGDVRWLSPGGAPLETPDWRRDDLRSFAVEIDGPTRDGHGAASVLVLVNGAQHELAWTLPAGSWTRRLDTASACFEPAPVEGEYLVAAFSIVLLGADPGP